MGVIFTNALIMTKELYFCCRQRLLYFILLRLIHRFATIGYLFLWSLSHTPKKSNINAKTLLQRNF